MSLPPNAGGEREGTRGRGPGGEREVVISTDGAVYIGLFPMEEHIYEFPSPQHQLLLEGFNFPGITKRFSDAINNNCSPEM